MRNNPHLFNTKIISEHRDRKEALEYELDYQLKNKVVEKINSRLEDIQTYKDAKEKIQNL